MPERLKRLEEFTLADLEAVRILLRGDSVIDWHRLHLEDEASARAFLESQEFQPDDPADRARLRDPAFKMMAVQNLSEHVQGNHFLRPDEIEAAFAEVGMSTTTYLFRNGSEAVIVGRKP